MEDKPTLPRNSKVIKQAKGRDIWKTGNKLGALIFGGLMIGAVLSLMWDGMDFTWFLTRIGISEGIFVGFSVGIYCAKYDDSTY